jgi:hypothetical protein
MIKAINIKSLFNATLIVVASTFMSLSIVRGNYIFWVPLILLAIWAWIRFASKDPAAAIMIIIFFAEEGFDIFNFGFRQRFLSDLSIALMLPIILLNLHKVWQHTFAQRSPYAKAIFIFFICVCISQYAGASLKFGQPFDVGLIVARKHLLISSYFFLAAIGANKEICYRFLKYLAYLGALLSVLLIAEVALGAGTIFSHYYAIGQERAGQLRIHVGTFLVVFSVIYSFIKFQTLTKDSLTRLFYVIIMILGLATIISIIMTRAVFLGLLLTFLFWISYHFNSRKMIFLCYFAAIISVAVLSGFADYILTQTFLGQIFELTKTEAISGEGTMTLRFKAAIYYIKLMIKNSPLFGLGIFSTTNYPNNPISYAAEKYWYLPVDINGLTTLIHFGLQGALLLLFFASKSIIDCHHSIQNAVSKEKYNFEILLLIFIYILATPTLNNLLVESTLIYSGAFLYLLSISIKDSNDLRK